MANSRGKTARRLWAAMFALAILGFGGKASAILLDRGPDMVYDTVLDITWTRQAGDGVFRKWADANAWAAALVFGGFNDWRLPYASVSAPNGGVGPITTLTNGFPCTGDNSVADETACRDSEMAYMFFYNLDGNQFGNKTGTRTAVGGETLTGIVPAYWSATEFDSEEAWINVFFGGDQFHDHKNVGVWTWAVRDGDVAAVPVPGTLLLLVLGALGLGWARRRKS